ncbi:MAG: gliding motility protein GldN [Bacteroidota bacterium]
MKTFVKSSVLLLALIILAISANAQNVLDGVYIKEHTPERKVIPYSYLREADVMWSKRMWRRVDMREKINLVFYYPDQKIANRRSLTQVIWDGITIDGTITPYMDDEFKKALTKAEVEGMFAKTDTTYVDELGDGNLVAKIITDKFEPSKVKKFRIKEDWFFDKQRSVMDVRILGIAPEVTLTDDNGNEKGSLVFWIYYPEARYVFANAEVFNRQNDGERRTFQDIFWKRMFNSYIYKEQNVYDRQIKEYKNGKDALLEADRVKNDLFDMEHDLWEF